MNYAEPTIKAKVNEVPVIVYKDDSKYKEFPTLKSTHEYFLKVFPFSGKRVWDTIKSSVDAADPTPFDHNGINYVFRTTEEKRLKRIDRKTKDR